MELDVIGILNVLNYADGKTNNWSGYSVPPGDRVLLMVSPGSFPTSWPASHPTNLTVLSGSLRLPLTDLQPPQLDRWFSRPDLQPRLGPAKNVEAE